MKRFVSSSAYVAGDISTASTNLQNITGLEISLTPNEMYSFLYFIVFQASLPLSSIKLDLSYPANPASITYNITIPGLVAAVVKPIFGFNSITDGIAVISENTDYLAMIEGRIINGSTAGTIIPQFASNNALSTATIKTMSCLLNYYIDP